MEAINRAFSHIRTQLKKMVPNIRVWCVAIFSQSQPTIIWSPELNSPSQPSAIQGEGFVTFLFYAFTEATCSLLYFPFQAIHSFFHPSLNTQLLDVHSIPGPALGSGHRAVLKTETCLGELSIYMRYISYPPSQSLQLDTQLNAANRWLFLFL